MNLYNPNWDSKRFECNTIIYFAYEFNTSIPITNKSIRNCCTFYITLSTSYFNRNWKFNTYFQTFECIKQFLDHIWNYCLSHALNMLTLSISTIYNAWYTQKLIRNILFQVQIQSKFTSQLSTNCQLFIAI